MIFDAHIAPVRIIGDRTDLDEIGLPIVRPGATTDDAAAAAA